MVSKFLNSFVLHVADVLHIINHLLLCTVSADVKTNSKLELNSKLYKGQQPSVGVREESLCFSPICWSLKEIPFNPE